MTATLGFFDMVRESRDALARGHVSAGLDLLDRVPFDESKVKRDKGRFAKKAGAAVEEAIETAVAAPARPGRKRADPRVAPATRSAPRQAAPKGKPKLPDKQTLEQAFTGEFGRFTTTNVTAKKHGRSVWHVSGDIHADGHGTGTGVAGSFSRYIRKEPDGSLVAVHENLRLDYDLQGQGFAEAFNKQAVDWYRSIGVSRIELEANVSVGGYAWARAGYDWQDADAASIIRERADAIRNGRTLGDGVPLPVYGHGLPPTSLIPEGRRKEQLSLLRSLQERLDAKNFGADDYPTPFEVSQLGRWDGAGKDDWWAGKLLLMGSSWAAVRTL